MAIQWIRPDFEAPMMRVQAMLEENLADLRARWPQAAMWERALDATLEIARGFRRMARPQLVLLGWLGAGGGPRRRARIPPSLRKAGRTSSC